MTPSDRIRAHAKVIRELLSEEPPKHINAQIWHALVERNGRVYSASLHKLQGQPIMAQLQLPADEAIATIGAAVKIAGTAITVEEMAIFLCLDQVDPEAVRWVPHAFDAKGQIIQVYQHLDNLKLN